MAKLPEEFSERMQTLLGEDYQAFLDSYQEPRRFGLRVNTAKISVEDFRRIAPFHLTQIPWVDNGFYYEEEDQPSRHAFYYAGLYYLQEPSAMTPASILPVEPGEKVLDLCAAPGGKATELGARLRGQGLLVANDISASRAKALLKNIEVFGIPNSFILNEVPGKIAEKFEGFFDKILVDAPCSGEGMFRKDPDVAKAWTPQKPASCAKIQKEIILRAARMLRPGGMLLYSTCTFAPEENEQVIRYLLETCPEFRLLPIRPAAGQAKGQEDFFAPGMPSWAPGEDGSFCRELELCARIWPHKLPGEGHFLALLQKGEPSVLPEHRAEREGAGRGAETPRSRISRADQAILDEFFRDVSMDLAPERLEIRRGQVYFIPEYLDGRGGLTFLRNGLYLGELKKDRFEPSQSFAMALRRGEYASSVNFSWTDERVFRYLKGETVSVDDIPVGRSRGWQLVCVNGYPLGWGKLTGGLLKNKYLAGWRMK
ncbi:MAG: RsmB/NOP family class I SAM-dependent RNA methyltransferase [Candidatus Limivivens sp.]|nr:RsmB/NOP family class I SAM-dependent RNA methyltransferase [Candidatus Limivivens sp.]